MTKTPLILGSKVYFARKEDNVSDEDTLPGDQSAAWSDLGYITNASITKNSEDVELFAPAPGALQLIKTVPIKATLTYNITLAEFSPQVIEFLWGTEALDDQSNSFDPLTTMGALEGWLRTELYDQTNDLKVTTKTWCMLKPSGPLKADGQSFAELECEARVLKNDANVGAIAA